MTGPFSTRRTASRHATLTDHRLALPRIEVPGWFTAGNLADALSGSRR